MERKDNVDTASLFMNGGSQAVRLPREYRFEGERVRIRREGGRVILEPLEKRRWPKGFWDSFDRLEPVPDDFDVPERLPPTPQRDTVLDEF
jgi:antitoxin VapB